MTWHLRLALLLAALTACLVCCTLGGAAIENYDCCYSAAQVAMVGLAVLGLALRRFYDE